MNRPRITVARAENKFSCAHMTVFPDGRKERLHGHNYTVALALELESLAFDRMIDFASLKRVLVEVCAEWRERTLVPARSRFVQIERRAGEVELTVAGKRYVLPEEDVLILPIDNTSVEALAEHWADLLVTRLALTLRGSAALALEVTIEESPGQGATATRALASRRHPDAEQV